MTSCSSPGCMSLAGIVTPHTSYHSYFSWGDERHGSPLYPFLSVLGCGHQLKCLNHTINDRYIKTEAQHSHFCQYQFDLVQLCSTESERKINFFTLPCCKSFLNLRRRVEQVSGTNLWVMLGFFPSLIAPAVDCLQDKKSSVFAVKGGDLLTLHRKCINIQILYFIIYKNPLEISQVHLIVVRRKKN